MRFIRFSRLLQLVLVPIVFGLLLSHVLLPVAHAEKVTPKESVSNHVNIREMPLGTSTKKGILLPGEQLDYIKSVPRWHEVRMSNGQSGFVSKSWTVVIPDPVNISTVSTFAVHFLDVGTGDSTIIDVGNQEIVIDGGDSTLVLNAYSESTGIIDGQIELLVVTHGDTDHWKGLKRLLGFDGVEDDTPGVLEFWDAGYNRDCNPASSGGRANYLQFIQNVKDMVPSNKFLRPLEDHRTPADVSGQAQPFTISSVPGVTITLLHSNSSPDSGSCSYKINNASIVMMVEIDGIRFLFTGDANGKERDEGSPGTPKYVEEKLLALEQNHPGLLKADVLKVPHHGSETASTQSFIDAVDPQYVIISASTKHHLPRSTVIERYQNGQRVILRTDDNRENDRDHIICMKLDGALQCNNAEVFNE